MLSKAGDVSEILKRDQRTIKNALVTVGTIRTGLCGGCRKEKSNKFSIRLVQVFIFGVCFLSIVRIPTAMTAPASCRDREEQYGYPPKWKNPCGQEFLMDNSGGSSSEENDTVIITSILTAANLALEYIENFKENYVKVVFQSSYEMQMELIKNHGHKYLPNKTQVPKYHGKKVDPSHLESRRLDQFLQDMYQWMQMYANAIEQVVLDQEKVGGQFRFEFTETESNLRKVLCELRSGMNSKNITPENKVERCLMEDSYRNLTETAHRNFRDLVILSECMLGLEYLIEVLEYLEAKSSS